MPHPGWDKKPPEYLEGMTRWMWILSIFLFGFVLGLYAKGGG